MRSKAIVRAILEDREQRKLPPPPAGGKLIPCFKCGKAIAYHGPHGDDSGRFCSGACRIEYDSPGTSSFDPFKITRWRKVASGDPGYLLATPMQRVPGRKHKDRPEICGGWHAPCRGCCKPFESFGWAYCSQECKRASREREANEVDMAAAGIERPTKRKCLECGHNIPRWRNARAVSKATKYCSDKCATRARRKVRTSRYSPSGVLSPETAKKCPENGPSRDSIFDPRDLPINIVGGYRPVPWSEDLRPLPAPSQPHHPPPVVEAPPIVPDFEDDPVDIPAFLRRMS